MKPLHLLALLALTAFPALAQDQTGTAIAGSNVTLSASADGTEPLRWQWKKNGEAIAGATSASFTITGATTADAGAYAVTVANDYGTATSDNYTLTIGVPPSKPVIKSTLSTITVEKKSDVRFQVVAEGPAPLRYQWLKNGLPLSGQTSAVIAYTRINPSYAGRYSVNVENAGGKVSADIVDLRVR